VRKEAGRPLDLSSDVIVEVRGLTAWERREWQRSSEKARKSE